MGTKLLRWGLTLSSRLKNADRDRGAGFVEYAGLLLLISAIVVAVVALNLHTAVADAIRGAVGRVLNP
ncbi:hypothetical protein [Streptomyces bohaiensis]|uniref:Flp family type IVb pilin n=1 Tax=Streptomyces bohaiensis TaxID=1431344 RepID=A0ABX1CEL4_9ACTN|nr:hypothetical protein [Streptomyces bohaiensis]NJQ15639.1 hypothetical protein [Streptomyces bohaiensis]